MDSSGASTVRAPGFNLRKKNSLNVLYPSSSGTRSSSVVILYVVIKCGCQRVRTCTNGREKRGRKRGVLGRGQFWRRIWDRRSGILVLLIPSRITAQGSPLQGLYRVSAHFGRWGPSSWRCPTNNICIPIRVYYPQSINRQSESNKSL